MFSYIQSFFSDPANTLIFFLLAFPGRILALSVHEFAHAWVANRCGDPTAKMLGRMTVNPLKHLDPLGTIMMLLVGFGWARPVPVNPQHYRNYRRDDLLVSIAGVTMNLLMFALAMVLMFLVAALALSRVPSASVSALEGAVCRANYGGVDALFTLVDGEYYYAPLTSLLRMLPYAGAEQLIAPVFGAVAGHLYQMVGYFAVTNLSLCIFNLIPVPPLDGYHVLNDLVLRRRQLFANPNTARIASTALFVLAMSGTLGRGLSWVNMQLLNGAGRLGEGVFRLVGLL